MTQYISLNQAKELIRQLPERVSKANEAKLSECRVFVYQAGKKLHYKWQDLPTPGAVYNHHSFSAKDLYQETGQGYVRKTISRGHLELKHLIESELTKQLSKQDKPNTPNKPTKSRKDEVLQKAQQFKQAQNLNGSLPQQALYIRQHLMDVFKVATQQMGTKVTVLFKEEPVTFDVSELG